MGIKTFASALAAGILALAVPAQAQTTAPSGGQGQEFEALFDRMLGTQARAPQSYNAVYEKGLEQRIAALADGSNGRIGVSAVDLSTGQSINILGDQRFPMASTSKIAVAAAYLEGVERGRWTLTSEFPLLWPQRSAKFSSRAAPVKAGAYMPAIDLIEIMITRSSNPATDALLRVVGGPTAVNDWTRRNGISEFSIDRDIATLVRDDGEFNPAQHIDPRDSATPAAMVDLLAGLYQGKYLTAESRRVILSAMSRTRTGKRRIRHHIPAAATVMHKTGSLNNTSSDIGIIETPDGRAIAMAIYVTGQGARSAREAKIAAIARALYDGFSARPNVNYADADYGGD